MAVMSIIKLSESEKIHRIDAEYFKPEYALIEDSVLKTNSYTTWNRIGGKFITGPFGSEFRVENYVPDSPYRYVRGKDVKEFFLLDDDNVYIPKNDFERLNKYTLQEGDILISVVGTLGNAAIVDKDIPPAIFSCKSTLYRTKFLDTFYLIAYLNCKFGRSFLQRNVRGTVQTGLNIDDLKSVLIFLPKEELQKRISFLVIKAKEYYNVSKSFYLQAEFSLLEQLGIKDFKPTYKFSYTANLSDVFRVHRIDAEYFQPAYVNIIRKIQGRIALKPLGKFILGIQKGIEVGSDNYEEEGKPFIRVSNLSINGLVDRDQKYISEELYQRLKNTYEPKEGDFLLTKDATPGIAYVVKEPVEGIISSGILKLKIDDNEVDKEYLALCINSLVGKMQIERDGGGSVIIHWKPEQTKRLQIPILPLEAQQKIASLVQQSHEVRRKAKELLEIAKKSVEIAIEKNEEEAMEYISKQK